MQLLFLGHVFPVAARHVVELLAGIHALLDADGLEVGAPEVLQQLVVAAHHPHSGLHCRIASHWGLVLT